MSIQPSDLLPYDEYLDCRQLVRKTMIAARRERSFQMSENIRLAFESQGTVCYQIQEVIYADKVNDEESMAQQIASYRHLVPGKNELTATLMYEYPDPEQANLMINQLEGVESTLFLRVGQNDRVYPFVNEDLLGHSLVAPVHYLRFALSETDMELLREGAPIEVGFAHHSLSFIRHSLPTLLKQTLRSDLFSDE